MGGAGGRKSKGTWPEELGLGPAQEVGDSGA